jgi:oxygen-independent coproporphyrinogen-3 oxidase
MAARQAGFDNLGLDLIFGLPGQSLQEWRQELATALELAAPEHLSCYMLTYEPQTPLEKQRCAGKIQPASDGHIADLFCTTSEFLTQKGYEHYEISNFARKSLNPGKDYRSRHNSKYWDFTPYLGFGPSAHSFLPPQRCWNHRSVSAYIADSRAGRLPCAGCETLTPAQEMMEAILLGLRTCQGIDLNGFQKRFGLDLAGYLAGILEPLQKDGWLVLDARRCYLTSKGMRMLDSIVSRLVAGLPDA